ncbi:MAG: CDP-alcohol phosphatidyltransferase family protein [Sandaracinaceae bacterium]|nr:CDP-alcohol phosphatidyltransferase family protein [Sandaracinaceae bacterium]
MIRSFVPADLVTMVNAACGMGAILAMVRYAQGHDATFAWLAFALLPIALVADILDGAVARATKRQSALGADLDSLADVVSFGAAPAVVGFTLGLDGGWDAIILVFFVACGISRLARFNVTAAALSEGTGKVKYYEGTPIPTTLGLVVVLVIAFWRGAVHDSLLGGQLALGPFVLHPLALAFFASGCAMVSTLRIPKP